MLACNDVVSTVNTICRRVRGVLIGRSVEGSDCGSSNCCLGDTKDPLPSYV